MVDPFYMGLAVALGLGTLVEASGYNGWLLSITSGLTGVLVRWALS